VIGAVVLLLTSFSAGNYIPAVVLIPYLLGHYHKNIGRIVFLFYVLFLVTWEKWSMSLYVPLVLGIELGVLELFEGISLRLELPLTILTALSYLYYPAFLVVTEGILIIKSYKAFNRLFIVLTIPPLLAFEIPVVEKLLPGAYALAMLLSGIVLLVLTIPYWRERS